MIEYNRILHYLCSMRGIYFEERGALRLEQVYSYVSLCENV